ncbi:MAG: heavy metal-binding domain-containing protein [Saprospiraceae bacterium]
MKKIAFVIALTFLGSAIMFGQTEPKMEAPKQERKMNKKQAGKQAGKKMYACPMKCVPASDKPGTCSKCKMDLVAVKQKNKSK